MRQYQASIRDTFSNHRLMDGGSFQGQATLQQEHSKQQDYEYRVRAYSMISNHPGYLMRVVGDEPRDTIPAPPLVPECRECSRPERPIAATHGELCVYCDHALQGANKRIEGEPPRYRRREAATAHVLLYTNGLDADKQARARLAAAERKAKPPATAESRMLALPHPWETDESEP